MHGELILMRRDFERDRLEATRKSRMRGNSLVEDKPRKRRRGDGRLFRAQLLVVDDGIETDDGVEEIVAFVDFGAIQRDVVRNEEDRAAACSCDDGVRKEERLVFEGKIRGGVRRLRKF